MKNKFYSYQLAPMAFKAAKVLKRVEKLNKLPIVYNDWRHQQILKYLRENYSDVIHKYQNNLVSTSNTNNQGKNIFVFWWQGLDKAPNLVKKCIQSIQRYSNGKKVIVITEENVRNYTSLPEYIYEYVKIGRISLTHFSDLLRFNLLMIHGGLWMDATIYVTDFIKEDWFCNRVATNGPYKEEDPQHFNNSLGRWTGFCIGGYKGNIFFEFVNEFFLTYWLRESKLIDYFLIDYIIEIALEKEIGINESSFINKKKVNPNMFKLQGNLNNLYDEKIMSELMVDTNMFKLSYKKTMIRNSATFYHMLFSNDK